MKISEGKTVSDKKHRGKNIIKGERGKKFKAREVYVLVVCFCFCFLSLKKDF